MLSVSSLRVEYGTTVAVDTLDLTVGAGEIVCLLGPNGAGKTSTLHAISRVVPSRGRVSFAGTDITTLRADAVARLGLVQVPEGRRVFPTLTVEENLLVGRSARNGRPDPFGLAGVVDLFPALGRLMRRDGWTLSGGEQQMVAIGRALMAAPRLMLLDEPSLGLAPIVVRELFRALRDIGREIPLLLVEQNTGVALAVSSRCYVLVSGRIVLAGDAAEVGGRHELVNRFLGQADLDRTDHGPTAAVQALGEPTTEGTATR